MFVLAGDVGGTNSRLAVFDYRQGKLSPVHQRVYASQSAKQFSDILSGFLGECSYDLQSACIGVAGPVSDGRCAVTNLPWALDAMDLSRECQIPSLVLINDLEANAYGVDLLKPGDVTVVRQGNRNETGNRAVISPGTGLGEAGMLWSGTRYQPFATEGGHCDFGPRSALQESLLNFLQESIDHVSYEEILCGGGLERIYDFFASRSGVAPSADFKESCSRIGKAATISAWAMTGNCPTCEQVLDLYLEILGQESGNLALKVLATGGLFLGGGIAAKLAPAIQCSDVFQRGFLQKGKMSDLLSGIPVSIILNPDAALLGAANVAARLLESRTVT